MENVGQPYSLHFLGHKLPSIKAHGSPSPCLTIYEENGRIKNPLYKIGHKSKTVANTQICYGRNVVQNVLDY